MPAIAPLIPLIASGIGAIGTGVSLFEQANQPGLPQQQATVAKPPDQTAEKEAFLTAAPSVQERLGGAVAPDFFANEVARLTGNAGDTDLAKSVLSQYLGLGDSNSKTGLTNSSGPETAGGQNFSPFNINQGGTGQVAKPDFFEGLLGGHDGGTGLGEFSGGYQ